VESLFKAVTVQASRRDESVVAVDDVLAFASCVTNLLREYTCGAQAVVSQAMLLYVPVMILTLKAHQSPCPSTLGHGGHLDHALEWFGGVGGYPVREVCPTGCGTYLFKEECCVIQRKFLPSYLILLL
jgi:hypothetical protein